MGSCDNTIALKPGTVGKAQTPEIDNEFPGTASQMARRRCARGRGQCDLIVDECRGLQPAGENQFGGAWQSLGLT
jgi:hypothetical protein